jgi:hypothetical protein
MAASCAQDWDRAAAHFESALERAAKLPNVMDEPQVQHFYAQMLADRGRPDDRQRARELAMAAVDGYRRLGIPVRLAMAEDLVKRWG